MEIVDVVIVVRILTLSSNRALFNIYSNILVKRNSIIAMVSNDVLTFFTEIENRKENSKNIFLI